LVKFTDPTFDKIDGKPGMIPAFLYKPKNKKGPLPVIIDIHGGPEGQELPYFSSTTQFWLNELGVAVLAPNVRGSSGYGKSFLKLDNDYKREDSVKDIGKLLDWIKTQPDLDANRVAVIGGSYGGYMVLSSMVNYNERIRCGVDIVGISNFVTFLKNTKEYRQDLRRVEYGDERDPKMAEFLQKISPTTNSDKITKPLFVVQGLNDPRVPASEAEQMVAEIRKNKGDVWYMLAKDEGHGFRKKTNRDHYTAAVILFFEKYLLK
jgi:dipeptidyl aminopeptidase/acylaminoacyl peptidase